MPTSPTCRTSTSTRSRRSRTISVGTKRTSSRSRRRAAGARSPGNFSSFGRSGSSGRASWRSVTSAKTPASGSSTTPRGCGARPPATMTGRRTRSRPIGRCRRCRCMTSRARSVRQRTARRRSSPGSDESTGTGCCTASVAARRIASAWGCAATAGSRRAGASRSGSGCRTSPARTRRPRLWGKGTLAAGITACAPRSSGRSGRRSSFRRRPKGSTSTPS